MQTRIAVVIYLWPLHGWTRWVDAVYSNGNLLLLVLALAVAVNRTNKLTAAAPEVAWR